jgi:4,5-dihydroxyphthalate decarboxylase
MRYERTKALFDGEVGIEGCRPYFEEGRIGDLNRHVFDGPQTLDVTEIGLHPFMLAYGRDGFRDYALLPIFPLRLFRHRSIFIGTDRGIDGPADLKGRTVATPGYAQTSLVWIRGMLQDEYGITPSDVRWMAAAADSSADLSGKTSAQEASLPTGVEIEQGPPGVDESDLLVSGQADVLFHAVEPRAYQQGDPRVTRLFPDYRATEREYFERTGIFPIMHAVAVRRSLLDERPWLAGAIFDAYVEAKQRSYVRMTKWNWVGDGLPWYGQELAETKALMGGDFYTYGIDGSRAALEALFRYSNEQSLTPSLVTIEDLFHPASLESAG